MVIGPFFLNLICDRSRRLLHRPPLLLIADEVKLAVICFQHGSAAEISGLRPQHIKDCLANGEDCEQFLSALTELCNLMLTGDIPEEVKPVFAGANLIALMKKDGGIRPIASG